MLLTKFLQRGSGLDAFTTLVLLLAKLLKRAAMFRLELLLLRLLERVDARERLRWEEKRRRLACQLVRHQEFLTNLLVNSFIFAHPITTCLASLLRDRAGMSYPN